MDAPDLLFVVGFPRSGTTWLRALFGEHPEVATLEAESYLFEERYLAGLDASWQAEQAHVAGGGRAFALSAILDAAEFDALLRDFAAGVLAKLARARPEARLVVEKTPTHANHAGLILRLFPDARFLHVVRDPREVYCSTRAASRGWGRFWASGDLVDVSRRWVMLADAADSIKGLTPRYRKVRYEDLLSDTPGELARILEWLELRHDAGLCAQIAEACSLDRLRERWAHNPGFFRRGAAAGWREELRPAEVRTIEFIAGERMQAEGYELSRPRGAKPLSLRARDVLARVASFGARGLNALAEGPLGSGRRRS